MALTVRLSPRAERTLNSLAKRLRQTRSDLVREAIEQYGSVRGAAPADDTPYQAWADVIGIVDTGARDPDKTTGEQFGEIVRRKARARRPR